VHPHFMHISFNICCIILLCATLRKNRIGQDTAYTMIGQLMPRLPQDQNLPVTMEV
jgi:hypothetical protein